MDSGDIIALLRQPGEVRAIPADKIKVARAFFRDRISSIIGRGLIRHHPLGFFYAVEQQADGVTLRYHVWPTNWSTPHSQIDSEIHDHLFELNSLVLLGAIRHETFNFVPSPHGDSEVIRIRYEGHQARLLRNNEFGDLTLASDCTLPQGTAYRLSAGIVHRARATSLPAVTLVVAVPDPSVDSPRIIVKQTSGPPEEFPRPLLSSEEIDAVNKVLAEF